ncbi:MAG: hypothetical protein RMK89_08180 [Armatimonadota bacterium]|nr:hypothetical protein [Armatimonadota bacterium]MDW8143422.1 hypothetical protein [Armatimonadota bacterium]
MNENSANQKITPTEVGAQKVRQQLRTEVRSMELCDIVFVERATLNSQRLTHPSMPLALASGL